MVLSGNASVVEARVPVVKFGLVETVVLLLLEVVNTAKDTFSNVFVVSNAAVDVDALVVFAVFETFTALIVEISIGDEKGDAMLVILVDSGFVGNLGKVVVIFGGIVVGLIL